MYTACGISDRQSFKTLYQQSNNQSECKQLPEDVYTTMKKLFIFSLTNFYGSPPCRPIIVLFIRRCFQRENVFCNGKVNGLAVKVAIPSQCTSYMYLHVLHMYDELIMVRFVCTQSDVSVSYTSVSTQIKAYLHGCKFGTIRWLVPTSVLLLLHRLYIVCELTATFL